MSTYHAGPVGFNPLLEVAKAAMTPAPTPPSFTWATVTALLPLTVTLDDTVTSFESPSCVVPNLAVNDRVLLVTQNRRMAVLGKAYPDQ